MDNIYTSLRLVQDLEKRNVCTCGTIRADRGRFPDDFKQKKLSRGESLFISIGNVNVVHWFDKRDVFVMSNIHGSETTLVKRRGNEEITTPNIICEYNKYMNGMDKCHQYLASYCIDRQTWKWWKKLFFRMIDIAVVNTFIIY